MSEALRPLVSTAVAMVMFFIWVLASPNNILDLDPRCMFYLTGTVFSNICCRLIIAQMSNTRMELLSGILAPSLVAILLALVMPGISATTELGIMYTLTGKLRERVTLSRAGNSQTNHAINCSDSDDCPHPLRVLCRAGDV